MSSRQCQEIIFVKDAREKKKMVKTVEDQGCGENLRD